MDLPGVILRPQPKNLSLSRQTKRFLASLGMTHSRWSITEAATEASLPLLLIDTPNAGRGDPSLPLSMTTRTPMSVRQSLCNSW